MKTVAVFFGGKSNEHEISVITGMFAVNLLRGAGYRVMPVFLPLDGGLLLAEKARGVEAFRSPVSKSFVPVALRGGALVHEYRPKKEIAKIDCALNCCHGGAGEDGTLSALLRWHGVKSASPGAPVSAVFMDKELSKIAAKGLGIPVVRSFCVREEEWRSDGAAVCGRIRDFGFPVIVKPCKLGSSIGIAVVDTEEKLPKAMEFAFRLDSGVLVEEYLAGKRDLNCAAYWNAQTKRFVFSPVEEVFSGGAILTFGDKYEGTGARKSQIPADIPDGTAREIADCMQKICAAFSVEGVVRADFLYAGGKWYFNELNAVPGSLAVYLFGESLTQSRDLLVALVEAAIAKKDEEKLTLKTGILGSGIFTGGKTCKRR